MYLRAQDREDTPWRILCPRHGPVCLTKEEYAGQMSAAARGWECPAFDEGDPDDPDDVGPGVCGARSEWDDEWHDEQMEKEREEDDARFERDLRAVFGERCGEFSDDLRSRLHRLWVFGQDPVAVRVPATPEEGHGARPTLHTAADSAAGFFPEELD